MPATSDDSTLDVRADAQAVVDRASQVQIDEDAIAHFVEHIPASSLARSEPDAAAYLGFADGTARTAQYVLVADAMNFSFWGDPKWSVQVGSERLDGWWGFIAALRQALDHGWPLLEARWLRTARADDLARIFQGQGELPLLEARAAHLREAGRVLVDRYRGQFIHMVEAAGGSAVRLVRALVRELPSFDDVATYRGRPVHFYKRAQITAADLAIAFGHRQWGAFTDLDQLTAFADYKLPQVLRREGILVYAPALAAQVEARQPLEAGSETEVEIRAATIWAVELLARAFAAAGRRATAVEIDELLWGLGQRADPRDRPYHRTRTIFY
jgi:hypothetical protein